MICACCKYFDEDVIGKVSMERGMCRIELPPWVTRVIYEARGDDIFDDRRLSIEEGCDLGKAP